MPEPPVTRPSLLVRIRDNGDTDAWRQFIDLYAPMIYGLARRKGLQDADAADLTQEVLRTIATRNAAYDADRGAFRGWLYTVTRNRIRDFVDGKQARHRGDGGTDALILLNEQPAADDDSEHWDREYEQQVFNLAAEQVRGEFAESTWQAFWKVAVEGVNAEEAAQSMGLSVGAVYVAKSRVLARLRRQIQQLQGE
jgi:RNA polymerase sigma-70 factor (ECF subfamily)